MQHYFSREDLHLLLQALQALPPTVDPARAVRIETLIEKVEYGIECDAERRERAYATTARLKRERDYSVKGKPKPKLGSYRP